MLQVTRPKGRFRSRGIFQNMVAEKYASRRERSLVCFSHSRFVSKSDAQVKSEPTLSSSSAIGTPVSSTERQTKN